MYTAIRAITTARGHARSRRVSCDNARARANATLVVRTLAAVRGSHARRMRLCDSYACMGVCVYAYICQCAVCIHVCVFVTCAHMRIYAYTHFPADLRRVYADVRVNQRARIGAFYRTHRRKPPYTRTRIHAYTHTRKSTYTHTPIVPYKQTRIHAFAHRQIRAYAHSRIHAYTHTFTHTHIDAYTHIRIHAYTHIRIRAYTHTCTNACLH
jgi:hypothetical protein